MLTIKDLTASKELDSKEMAGVSGGTGLPSFGDNIVIAPVANTQQTLWGNNYNVPVQTNAILDFFAG